MAYLSEKAGPAVPPESLSADALFLRRNNSIVACAKIMSGLLLAVVGETMEANKNRDATIRSDRGAPRLLFKLSDVPLQRLGDLLLGHCSDDLLDNLSVLEQQQRGDSLNAIASG